ncbi:hypothetical protein F443_21322 [Phytophthora nicotianae P1569]|uniref:Uncharacterized protein n=1 Tax=Phytophthora nicotianae P1569 TaxID=1317065 RepID=V9DYI6_PHYNI|nr:hypothetical protein F443_21322 [Phytophthora nicotianae P1569]
MVPSRPAAYPSHPALSTKIAVSRFALALTPVRLQRQNLAAMSSRATQLSWEASLASVSSPAASRTISTTSASTPTSSMAPSSAISAISVTKSAPAVSLTTMSSAPAPAPAVSTSASSSATVESHQSSAAISSHLPAPRLSEIEGTALHGLLMDAAEETSDRIVAVFGSRITEAVRCLVQLVINPPQPVDPARDRAIAAAASVDDLAGAVSNPASDPRDLAAEIGDLKARLTDARLAKLIAQRSAGEKQQKLTDLETRFRQSRAECSSLEQALAAETKQRITAEEQPTALSTKMMVHDEVVLRVQKALETANEARASQSRKINHDWQLYKKNLRIYADRLERFHRYLTGRGQSVENLDQKAKRKLLKEELKKVLLVNKYLRKFVDDRDLDPDALLLFAEGGALGELDIGLLGLDKEAVELVQDAVKDLNPSLSAKDQAIELARQVHRFRSVDLSDDDQISISSESSSEDEDERFDMELQSVLAKKTRSSRSHKRSRDDKSDPRSNGKHKKARSSQHPTKSKARPKLQSLLKSSSKSKMPKSCSETSSKTSLTTTTPSQPAVAMQHLTKSASKTRTPTPQPSIPAPDLSAVAIGSTPPESAPVTPVPASSSQKSTQVSQSQPLTAAVASMLASLSPIVTPASSALPMPPLRALLTPVALASAQSSSPTAKTTSQPALSRSSSLSSLASTVDLSPSSPDISSAASPGPISAPDSSQNINNLASTLQWSPMAPSSRSIRTAAAISRWVTSQVIAQESDKSSVFIGAPGQTPPASPRGASEDEHEETKENDSPPALQLQDLEDMSSTGVSSRTRSAYRSIPMSALDPSLSTPPPASVRPASNPLKPSKKILAKVQRYLKPNFQKKGALRCWNLVHSFRTPLAVLKGLVAACSVEGIRAFDDWRKTEHPWRILNQKFPDTANLFDVSPFMPDVFISLRAPKRARTVKLWRQTHGFDAGGNESDVGLALWERGHWVVQSEIEAAVKRLAETHGDSSSIVRNMTRVMDAYFSGRNRRADNLRNKIMQLWDWCVDNDVPTEFILEPTMLWYSYEVLPWVPTTADWCSEVAALDEREPWRNCWIDVPSEHPFNTAYVPCNANAELFVPCGLTEAEVGRAVVVDEELAATDISPSWHQLVSIWSSDSDSTEVSSVAEDEDQAIDEIQSSQGLNALASAAASATL